MQDEKVQEATKHENLWREVKNIDGVEKHTKDLLAKIIVEDSTPPNDVIVDQRAPSLKDVFNDSTNHLDIKYKEIHNLLEEINSALFVNV